MIIIQEAKSLARRLKNLKEMVMTVIKVHLEISSKPRADKRSQILLRLAHHRDKRRLSTGVFVAKSDFNSQAKHGSWIKQSDSTHAVKNNILKDLLIKAECASAEVEKLGKHPHLKAF